MSVNQKGFTVTELLIVVVVTAFVTVALIAFMFNFWQYSYYSQANFVNFSERLNVNDFLRERLSASSGLITQNGIPDANVGLGDPSDGTGTYWNPVHAVPTTITAGQDSNVINPIIYYKGYSTASDKTIIMNGVIPYEDEFILYLDEDGNLRVRTLVNPSTIGTNRLTTSCPVATAGPSCPEDNLLISDVESVERRYFSRSGNLIDWESIWDSDINQFIGPDNGAVEVVELTINVKKKATFQQSETIQNSTIIRVALRNA